MILKLKRTPGIYLVGFMGSGKSTVGRLLAEHIGWLFVDLDEDIEREQKSTINELFSRDGEAAFRAMETEALRKRTRRISSGHPMVIALGGGAFTQDVNIDLVQSHGVSIWLDASMEVVEKRVLGSAHRPLARDPEKFRQLFHDRRVCYARADYHIEVKEDNSRKAFQAVLELPIFQ